MDQKIHNSTFEEYHLNQPTEKKFWNGSCGSSSISSIEKSYDPTEIKKIVDTLVMAKFGFRYEEKISRSQKTRCFLNPRTQMNSDFSIDTCNLSELISNERQSLMTANSRSNVMRYGNQAPCAMIDEMSSTEDSESTHTNPESTECYFTTSSFKFLNEKIVVLNQTKEQILKYIHYDNGVNGGIFSRERLEAEKLLLITDIKIDQLFNSPEEIMYDNTVLFSSGTLHISRIHIWPKEINYFDHYFICLITYKEKVYASEISKIKSNGVIFFNEEFLLSSLPPDFQISIKIYSITPKIFKKLSKSFICDFGRNKFEDEVPLRTSLFSLWCDTTFTLAQLNQSDILQLRHKSGIITASVSSSASVNVTMSGFVNVSQTSRSFRWNRQWCHLEGRFLKFFNYPPLSQTSINEPATFILDLSYCKFNIASREECPRSQTLLIKTENGQIFINCETKYEFLCWEEYLKSVTSQIEMWERSRN